MKLKKPTTFEQQIEILESRNIIIDDYEKALEFLAHVNYYRLTAYALSFKLPDGSYKEGTTFSQIMNIYHFDQELRALIFHVIETIEIHLRTQLSYHHAFKYGADGYMEADSFNKKHRHDKFMERINGAIHDNSKTLIAQHHNSKYDGKFPIWVITEFFSIGMLSYFYRGMKTSDRKELSHNIYDTTHSIMDSWMRCITDFRNKCAHYSRLYNIKFSAIPKASKNISFNPERSLFTQLIMLKEMYPYKNKWDDVFAKPLDSLVEKYSTSIDMNRIGFPEDWKALLFNNLQ